MKLLGVIFAVVIASCSATGPYKTLVKENQSLQLLSCPSDAIKNPAEHSILVIQSTIAEVNWVVEELNTSGNYVLGKVCNEPSSHQSRDYLKRTDQRCASLRFDTDVNGDVRVTVADNFNLHFAFDGQFNDWMNAFERVYSELRCYSDDILRKRATSRKVSE